MTDALHDIRLYPQTIHFHQRQTLVKGHHTFPQSLGLSFYRFLGTQQLVSLCHPTTKTNVAIKVFLSDDTLNKNYA